MPTYEDALAITTDLLVRYVEKENKSRGDIRPTDHVQHDLGLDSMSIMEFVADVEARFDVSIPKEMFTSIATVEDVARAVVKLASERAA